MAEEHAAALSAMDVTQGSFDVDDSGQATYVLDLDLPPGIAGNTPALSLRYACGQKNGLLGMGWTLTGLSAIARTRATYAVDGFNGAVTFGPDDRLALDGDRLINVSGAYGAADTVYYTEYQSWRRVRAGSDDQAGFTVATREGEVWCYGTTPDSLITTPEGAVRMWLLATITDRHGNTIQFTYHDAPRLADGSRGAADVGAYYLDGIAYSARSGAAAAPARRFVRATYARRPDPVCSFVGGAPVPLSYRLTDLTTLVDDTPVTRYALAYRQSTATGLSLLTRITRYGMDGAVETALPAHEMDYSEALPGFTPGTAVSLDQHARPLESLSMDVDGDGRTDVVQLWSDGSGSVHATTWLAAGDGTASSFVRGTDTELGHFPEPRQFFAADLNGDGHGDILVVYRSSLGTVKLAPFFSNGQGFDGATPFDTGDAWLEAKHIAFFPMDPNGDGRTDLVEAYGRADFPNEDKLTFRTWYADFTGRQGGFSSAVMSPTTDSAQARVAAFWPLDVNGDGMTDLVRLTRVGPDDALRATAYVSVSQPDRPALFSGRVVSDLGLVNTAGSLAFLPVDVNGDGVVDLLHVWKETTPGGFTLHLHTYFCNGAGLFHAGPDSSFVNQDLHADRLFPMNFRGAGFTDLLGGWTAGDGTQRFKLFCASPDGTYSLGPDLDAGPVQPNMQFFAGDVNGSGKADLVRQTVDAQDRVSLRPFLSAGPMPDLMTRLVDPLGGCAEVAYAPLSDPSVYTGDAGDFPSVSARRFSQPMAPAQFPVQSVTGSAMYVVSGFGLSADPTRNPWSFDSRFRMHYAQARIDLTGRGWQGFASVAKLDARTGRREIRTLGQAFPMTGAVLTSTVEADGTVSQDPLVGTGSHVLLLRTTNTYVTETRATADDARATPVVEVLPQRTLEAHYHYGENAFDYATCMEQRYDGYGNPIQQVNLGYVDPETCRPLDDDLVVTRTTAYRNEVRESDWILGLPTWLKVSANRTDADITRFLPGDLKLERRTYTSGACDLETQAGWDDGHDVWLTTAYGYDPYGNRTRETAPGNRTTTIDYDPAYHSFPMQRTSPPDEQGLELVTCTGFDPRFGAEVARKDANGHVTVTALDAFGRKTALQGPLPDRDGVVGDPNRLGPVTGSAALQKAFTSAAVVTLETSDYTVGIAAKAEAALQSFPTGADRDMQARTTWVDPAGRVRRTVTESGQTAGDVVVLKTYDQEGRVTSESPPFFSTDPQVTVPPLAVTTTYDVLGRAVEKTTPIGADGTGRSLTTWAYGMHGVTETVSAVGTPDAMTLTTVTRLFDGTQRVVRTDTSSSGGGVSTFTYDRLARLETATDPAGGDNPVGVATTITYDSLDRKRTLDTPDMNTTGLADCVAQTYGYDPVTGLMTATRDASGAETAYAYDDQGRMIRRTLPDGRCFRFGYDNASVNGRGYMTSVEDLAPDGGLTVLTELGYDVYGNNDLQRLTLEGEPAPYLTHAQFDPQKRRVEVVDPDAAVTTTTYAFGRLLSVTSGDLESRYPLDDYDPFGKACTAIYASAGITTHLTYNPMGLLQTERVVGRDGTVLNHELGYTARQKIAAVVDQLDGSGTQSFRYAGDRLVEALIPGFEQAAFGYAPDGNLAVKDGTTYHARAHFAERGTRDGETVFTAQPDACGRTAERTRDGRRLHFTYDGMGCLESVMEGRTRLLTVLSDYRGRRLRQIGADGTVEVFVSPTYRVTRPANGTAGSVTRLLADARGCFASATDVAVHWFRRDHKGSITHVFDALGGLLSQTAYGAFGEKRTVRGTSEGGPSYEQRDFVADTGLYYFGARWYDPVLGRFLTPDTRVGGDSYLQPDALNRFAFACNDPINLVDPTGHNSSWVAGLVIGIAATLTAIAVGVAIVATGGTITPLVGAGLAAVLGGGISGISYSATHQEVDDGKFWGGYFANVGVGAAVGFVSAGITTAAGAALETATVMRLSQTAQYLLRPTVLGLTGIVTSGGGNVLTTLASNGFDQAFVDPAHAQGLSDGLLRSAITGIVVGAVAGVTQGLVEAASIGRQWNMGGDVLDAEPVALRSMADEGTPLLQPAEVPYTTRLVMGDTLQKRAIMLMVDNGAQLVNFGLSQAGL